MNKQRAADVLIEAGCYINTRHTGQPPIELPDGSTVPVYLSCRRLIAQPGPRAEFEDALAAEVRTNFPSTDLIVGIATAGISWAHAIASKLDLPMAYVRGESKGYGIGKLVEGSPAPKSSAVIVDDVLFSGKSVFNAVEALMTEREISTVGAIGLTTLNGEGIAAYRQRGIAAVALTNYQEIIDSALKNTVLSEEEAETMRHFYQNSELN